MKREARFWHPIGNTKVQCELCAHNCKIADGNRGVCGVRQNEKGTLYTLIYGSYSSMAVDPIEKKPLYHFCPGTQAFSLGTAGCNFQCLYCQNYSISTAGPDYFFMKDMTPERTVELAKEQGCQGIAWTYNEPTIWHEFSFDTSQLAKKAGLYTAYVSNGYIAEDPLKEISPYLDAMNIDIKAFHDDFYKKICKARLEPVLQTCERARELGIHLEVTYLVIPGRNDSIDEIKQFCNWVVEKLGESTPVHFSRFHPDYKMTDVSPTPLDALIKIYDVAKTSGILFPYLGNVPHGGYENTVCPNCGGLCIERYGYVVRADGISDGKCKACGAEIPIVTDKYKK